MNLYKFLLSIYLFSIPSRAYLQCYESKPIFAAGGISTVYSCPGSAKSIINIPQFAYGLPFVYVITTAKDTVLKMVTTGVVDFKDFGEGEYRIYGFAYKGAVNDLKGKHLQSNRIANTCYINSSNYVTVIREQPAAPVFGAESNSPVLICAPDEKADNLSFHVQFPTNHLRKYAVVNESGKIIQTYDSSTVNADAWPCATCKVYAVSYSGTYLANIGTDISAALSDDCYSVSKNYLTVIRDIPKGGTIHLKNNSPSFICSESIQPQTIDLEVRNNKGGSLKYIVTDTANIVLEIRNAPSISSTSLRRGICKVLAVMYTGPINENILGKELNALPFTNDCYEFTSNSITLIKEKPDAGSFAELNDPSSAFCLSDSVRTFTPIRNGGKGAMMKWAVTDTSGKVEYIFDQNFKPGILSKGIKRLYSMSYTGNLLLTVGGSIQGVLSNDCYNLSKSFLTISIDQPLVGQLHLKNGASQKLLCASDTASSLQEFSYFPLSTFATRFFLTDGADKIIATSGLPIFDFKNLAIGEYRIYAVSHNGDLRFATNEKIHSSLSATYCHEISKNYITIIKGEAKAATVHFENNKDTLYQCEGATYNPLKLKPIINHKGYHQYLLLSQKDTLIQFFQNELNTMNLPIGEYKIRAIAYTDSFEIKAGSHISSLKSTVGCIDLSGQSLLFIKDQVKGATIKLANGDTTYQICSRDGWQDVLGLQTNSNSKLKYQYIATDEIERIIAFNANQANLELLNGVSKIYGVSYQGDISIAIGDTISKKPFSSECFEYSTNVVRISNTVIQAGTIRTQDNISLYHFCADNSDLDTLVFQKNGANVQVSYVYIALNEDTITRISRSGEFLSSVFKNGTTRIYGVAHQGTLNAKVGDLISKTRLADSCFGVSSNFVTIQKGNAEGGQITSSTGQNAVYLCPGDKLSDFINVIPSNASSLPYVYLITNAQDSILSWSTENVIDLDSFPLGLCKIHGLSYKGTLDLKNKKINSAALAANCFDVSDNFVAIFKSEANGGRITLANNDTLVKACVEDLGADTLRFKSSTTVKLNYALLITNQANRLVYLAEDAAAIVDVNSYDPGKYRVYGVSYGGQLRAFRNDDVTKVVLATGCYDLSDNFVELDLENSGTLCKNFGTNEKNNFFQAIYPNPVDQSFKVRLKPSVLDHGKPQLTLVSASGGTEQKIILSPQVSVNQEIEINTSNLTPGLYFLMFKNGYIFDRVKVLVVH